MMERVLIRAEIFGENAAGQKHICLLANNTDGIHFWTDDESIIRSIEPQRKKGKWINVRHDNIAECDQCGITGRAWMNFCFDCGADMRTPVETAKKYRT